MSTLCTILNSTTDKGVMVSLHLGSLQEAFGEESAFTGSRVDIVRCCADGTAHSEHDRAGHSTHSRGTGDTKGGGGVAVVLVVGRSVSARYTSPARARIAIAHSFCFVFRLSQLVTSSCGGNSAFAFLVAWFPSRWLVFGPLSSAPRRRFHQGSFLHTVTF